MQQFASRDARITLVNRDGREMDTVSYNDSGEWPVGAGKPQGGHI